MSYLKLPQFFTHLKTTDNCVSETIAKYLIRSDVRIMYPIVV